VGVATLVHVGHAGGHAWPGQQDWFWLGVGGLAGAGEGAGGDRVRRRHLVSECGANSKNTPQLLFSHQAQNEPKRRLDLLLGVHREKLHDRNILIQKLITMYTKLFLKFKEQMQSPNLYIYNIFLPNFLTIMLVFARN